MEIKLKMMRNLHNSKIHIIHRKIQSPCCKNTQDGTICGKIQLLEVTDFCHKKLHPRYNKRTKSIPVTVSLVYIKPKFSTNTLQILQGQSIGFHFLISCLKPSRNMLLISEGICSQIFGLKYETDPVPL